MCSLQKMFAVLCCSGLLCGAVSADEQSEISADEWVKTQARSQIRAGGELEKVKIRLRQLFKSNDVDGGGISKNDDVLIQQKSAAAQRARIISVWASQDLNGDGEVSREELEIFYSQNARRELRANGVTVAPTTDQVIEVLAQLTGKALKPDDDGDGVITFAEISAEAAKLAGNTAQHRRNRGRSIPLSMDLDGDGTVSSNEFDQSVDKTLKAIDADGSGTFSEEERTVLLQEFKEIGRRQSERRKARMADERLRKVAEKCNLPKASPEARIVLLGVNKGQALSNVAIDAAGTPITVANVNIEPGKEPLYVLLTSRTAMIWRISGALDRVSQIAVNSHRQSGRITPLAGVVGLSSDRVHMVRSADCLQSFTEARQTEAVRTNGMVRLHLGRPADIVVAQHAINTVHLPSGAFDEDGAYNGALELPEAGPAAMLWDEVRRYNRGGIVQIDPNAVETLGQARTMTVLPQEAGLAQLVEKGVLKISGFSNVLMFNNTRIVLNSGDGDTVEAPNGNSIKASKRASEFLILKKTRLPSGLFGPHMVRFVLARGVAPPEAPTSRADVRITYCILDEATGKMISGNPMCR